MNEMRRRLQRRRRRGERWRGAAARSLFLLRWHGACWCVYAAAAAAAAAAIVRLRARLSSYGQMDLASLVWRGGGGCSAEHLSHHFVVQHQPALEDQTLRLRRRVGRVVRLQVELQSRDRGGCRHRHRHTGTGSQGAEQRHRADSVASSARVADSRMQRDGGRALEPSGPPLSAPCQRCCVVRWPALLLTHSRAC